MQKREEWRDVPGFVGFCRVSDQGRVRTLYRDGTWILRSPDTHKYPGVTISVEGKKTRVGVHVLVLLAFKGECPDGMQAAHLDGDRYNNSPSNLEWKTAKANSQDRVSHATQTRGESSNFSKLTEKDVRDIRGKLLSASCTQVANEYNMTPESIRNIKQRRSWKHV